MGSGDGYFQARRGEWRRHADSHGRRSSARPSSRATLPVPLDMRNNSFDRIVLGLIAALILAIGVVVLLGDRVGVPIHEISPAAGSTPPVTAAIRVTFGQDMKRDSVETRFHIEPLVSGELRWEGRTLVFDPAAPLVAGQSYTITIDPGAKSLAGRMVPRPVSWSFVPREPVVLYLAPANDAVKNLWMVPGSGGSPVEVLATEYGIFNFAPSPDGTQIAVTVFNEDLSSEVWLVETDDFASRPITQCAPGNCANPTWAPESTILAYERQDASATGSPGPSRVWLYDVLSGETAPVFQDNQVLGFSPVWSPDGSRLAFFDANVQAIRVIDMDGGAQKVMPSQMGEVGSFSPDGDAMVYTDIRQVGQQFFPELWLAEFGDEAGIRPLMDQPEEDQSAVWSPDGRWIAFARRRLDRQNGLGRQLALYNVETTQIRMLTEDPDFNNTLFDWSIDSQRILVERFSLTAINGTQELWVYNLAEDTFTLLVNNSVGGRWMP